MEMIHALYIQLQSESLAGDITGRLINAWW